MKFQNTSEEFHSFIFIPLGWKKAPMELMHMGEINLFLNKISFLWAKLKSKELLISTAPRFSWKIFV